MPVKLAGDRLREGRNISFYNSDLGNIPDNSITFIFQDSEGRIWAGSSIGLLKHTSKGFESAPIERSNSTNKFNTDVIGYDVSSPGYIYLYYKDIGLCQYDVKAHSMEILVPVIINYKGQPKVPILRKDELIYFSHSLPGELYIYNLVTRENHLTTERICGDFVQGVKGGDVGLYCSDLNSLCLKYIELTGDTIEHFSEYSVQPSYHDVVELAGDTVMIFNRNGITALLHDRANDTLKVVNCATAPDGSTIFEGTITSVMFDSLSRELYFSTWGGIAIQSIDSWDVDIVTSKPTRQNQIQIKYAPVRVILKDNSGDLWLGYYENGISRIENLNVTFGNYLGHDGNLDQEIKDVLKIRRGVNGELFYLTKGGIVIQDAGYGGYQILRDNVTPGRSCNKDWYRDIIPLTTPNTYLVVTWGNYPLILSLNGDEWALSSLKPEVEVFPCFSFSTTIDTLLGYRISSNWGQGDALIATDSTGKHLYRYVRRKDGSILTPSNLCRDVHVERDNIYLSITDKGLVKLALSPTRGHRVNGDTLFLDLIDQQFDTTCVAAKVLAHSEVYSIVHRMPDEVIALSNRGVFSVQNDNSVMYHDMPDLGKIVPKCGVQTTDGHLWLGTPIGLFEYDSNLEKLIHLYNRNTGLISQNIQDVFLNDDDRLLLGTKLGVSYLIDDPIKLSQPSIIIDELFFDSVQVLPVNNIYISTPGRKSVTINYSSTDYQELPHNKVRYSICNGNDRWLEVSPSREIVMPLAPGMYELKIQECDSYGQWTSPVTYIYLQIPCKWYWSVWLWVLLIGGMVMVFLRIWLDHIETVKDKQKLKDTIQYLRLETIQAQMNPHFVFNMLGTIQYFILKNDRLSANRYLVKLSNLIRNFLDSSINSSIGENGYIRNEITLRKEIELITDYMEFERIQMNENFEFVLKIDDEVNIDNVTLPPMLLQPFLENSVKHGIAYLDQGGIILLKIWQEDTGLHVKIIDNGVGRIESRKRQMDSLRSYKSHGTDLVKKRIELLNGIGYGIGLTVTDLDEGYEVYLIIH